MKKRILPEVLTSAEEAAVMKQFNLRYFTSHRNQVMIMLALQTGMRVSELIKLKYSDITPSEGCFKVHIKQGKGKKDRMVFITPDMFDSLQELRISSPAGESAVLVFHTTTGEPVKDSYLRKMIKDKGARAGVPRLHFHLLRHTYLTRTFDKTKDIRVVQEIAGHASINTTMIYTHTSGEAVRAAMML